MMENLVLVQVITAIVQAVSTVILVVITLFYAFQTRATVKEISKQGKENILPLIVADDFHVPKEEIQRDGEIYCIHGSLTNIGNGAGLGILVQFYDKENKIIGVSENLVDYIYKGAKKEITIHMPQKTFDSVKYKEDLEGNSVGFIIVKIFFNDYYGDKYQVEQSFVVYKDNFQMVPMLGTMKFSNQSKRTIKELSKVDTFGIYH